MAPTSSSVPSACVPPISRRGENLASTIDAAEYLGLRWLRVGYESNIPVADLIELHKQTGVRFSYGLMSGGTDIARLLAGARQLASAGALLALEGNNEPNNWGVTYQGEAGGRDLSWLPVAKLQRDLYARRQGRPRPEQVSGLEHLSENGAETDNVGLQFLTIPEGAGCLMPDGTRYADFANCHNYMTHPGWPGLHDNQTWIAADPTSACKVDGLYGNYGRTWRRHYPGYSESDLSTLPRVTTETGVKLEGPITEQVQASLYLSVFLAQFKRGWSHTCIYLLRDRTDEGGNQTFGFYRPDYSPRSGRDLAAQPDDDPGRQRFDRRRPELSTTPSRTSRRPSTTCSSRRATARSSWWSGANGLQAARTTSRWIWARHMRRSGVYDPTSGTSPTQTLTNVSSISLTLSDHPVIIEDWMKMVRDTHHLTGDNERIIDSEVSTCVPRFSSLRL